MESRPASHDTPWTGGPKLGGFFVDLAWLPYPDSHRDLHSQVHAGLAVGRGMEGDHM